MGKWIARLLERDEKNTSLPRLTKPTEAEKKTFVPFVSRETPCFFSPPLDAEPPEPGDSDEDERPDTRKSRREVIREAAAALRQCPGVSPLADDLRWIEGRLWRARIPSAEVPGILDRYADEWRAGVAAEPRAVRAENAGRGAANRWLRERTERRPLADERRAIVEAGGTVTANIKTDRELIAWAKARGAYVRIDRQTRWGNPRRLAEGAGRDEVCAWYGGPYLDSRPELLADLGELRGKVLGCHCHPKRCHGDELIRRLGGEPCPG